MALSEDQDKLYTKYQKRLASLEQERNSHEVVWRDIRDNFVPYGALFRGERPNDGIRRDGSIINTSPLMAARTLPVGMQSGITSPARPWYRLSTPDPGMKEFEPIKLWLQDTERRMREVMARSNFYDKVKSTYSTLGNFGTGVLFMDDDDDKVISCYDLPIGTWCLASNHTGMIDTMYREIKLTTLQMMARFKRDDGKIPDRVQLAYDRGDYAQQFDVCHVIEPNHNYRIGSALPHRKKWASVWLFQTDSKDRFLAIRGYDDQPFFAPRWDVNGVNAYGQGCGHLAIGDAKQLQLMEKRKLQGVDKNVTPPMVADGSLRNQRTGHIPGSTTYVNGLISGKDGYKPAYQPNPYLNELREEIMRIEGHIEEAYFKNLFLMVTEIADQPNITATQINTMREEKLMMLGPVLERLNGELLDPMIDRLFSIMARRGMLPPPPKELQGSKLRVEYVSVLAQAQKAQALGNIERFVGFGGQLAQFDQGVLDKINFDQIIDEYADGSGVPPNIVRSDEDAQKIRQGRQAAQDMAEQMEMGSNAVTAAKTLSETSMTGDNLLTRVTGNA